MRGQFDDKVALITGGSSGIGRATALRFASEGAKVVVGARRIEEGEETVRMIKQAGGKALFFKTDVSKEADAAALVNKAVETYGRLDCAFNNAAVTEMGLTGESTEEKWNYVMNINLKGVWLCMKYEIQEMLNHGVGAIVNNSSVSGLIGVPGLFAYSASKHGVIGLTKTAALEYASEGIRINAVCPGAIDTAMMEPVLSDPARRAILIERHPIGRVGTP